MVAFKMKQLTTDTPRVWDVCRYAQDNYFENTAGELETWTLAVPGMTWYARLRLLKRSPNEPALRGRLSYSFIYTYSSLCLRHVSSTKVGFIYNFLCCVFFQ